MIEQIVQELFIQARAHPFNPMFMLPPAKETMQEFERQGLVFRVVLSQMLLPSRMGPPTGMGFPSQVPMGKHLFLLSVSKLDAVPNERGWLVPTDEEGEEVAHAFFPCYFARMRKDLDPLQGALKYMAIL